MLEKLCHCVRLLFSQGAGECNIDWLSREPLILNLRGDFVPGEEQFSLIQKASG